MVPALVSMTVTVPLLLAIFAPAGMAILPIAFDILPIIPPIFSDALVASLVVATSLVVVFWPQAVTRAAKASPVVRMTGFLIASFRDESVDAKVSCCAAASADRRRG